MALSSIRLMAWHLYQNGPAVAMTGQRGDTKRSPRQRKGRNAAFGEYPVDATTA